VPATNGRITNVRFAGLRTAASVGLELGRLTVLIGDNGVGKSTIIEGLELLRLVTSGEDFIGPLHDEHGGLASLITHGSTHLTLGLNVGGADAELEYVVRMSDVDGAAGIVEERFTRPQAHVTRSAAKVEINVGGPATIGAVPPSRSLLPVLALTSSHFKGVDRWLQGIEIHGAFATGPAWLRPSVGAERGARSDNIVQAASRLARGATNLPNAFHTLRNRGDWEDTLELVQLLVDDDVRDVLTPASASGGSIGLAVKYRTGIVPAFALSDGTLALLSLIAIVKLDGGDPPRSMLVLDEPDLHLHPSAIRHLVALLERCAEKYPVVVATHSDHLLDRLTEPARSTVLCDLDEHRHLRLRRPDPITLATWLRDYRGIGHLRADGYAGLVFPAPSRAAEP
jgi:predicted ATPase